MDQAGEMFAELHDVKGFHVRVGLVQTVNVPSEVCAVAVAAQPGWHETCVLYDHIPEYRSQAVVDQ